MPEVFAAIWEWVLAWMVGGALTISYAALVLIVLYVLALMVLGMRGLKILLARWKGSV